MLGCLKPPDVDIGAHSDIGAKIETRQSAVRPWRAVGRCQTTSTVSAWCYAVGKRPPRVGLDSRDGLAQPGIHWLISVEKSQKIGHR